MGQREKILVKCKICNGTGINKYATMDGNRVIILKAGCNCCGGDGYMYLGEIDEVKIERIQML